jgi:hypothetical protein
LFYASGISISDNMTGHNDGPSGCPLAAVDRRLSDAHRLWHEAEAAYFDPDAFRIKSQLVIQTLRSITFILQNQKRRIPGFDEWYGTQYRDGLWQKRLRDIPLMRWLVKARNKIEKQGDLEAESFVRAEIIASHLDEGPRVEVPARLFEGPEVLLRRIPAGAVSEHVRAHGTLKIERRWVESDLPEFELLDALATAYGHLSELVAGAHRQMGLAPPRTEDHETGERFDAATLGWRLPCMIGHDQPRASLLSLSDGSRISFQSKDREIDLTGAEEKLTERYGAGGIEVFKNAFSGGREGVPKNLFDAARMAFLRDGYHLPLLLLLRDYKPVKILFTPIENRGQKYLQMRHLAAEVVRYSADAAISIGEAWMASLAEIKGYQSASEVPTRKEVLGLVMVSKSGEPVQYMAMIERDGKNVFLGETFVTRGLPVWEFAPFYQAWGRPIPGSWNGGFHDAGTDRAPNKVPPERCSRRVTPL